MRATVPAEAVAALAARGLPPVELRVALWILAHQGAHTRFFGAEVAGSIGVGISAVHSAFSSLLEQGVIYNAHPSERTGRALRVVEDPLRWKPAAA